MKPGQRLGTLGGPHTLGLQAVTYFAPADARRLPRGLAMEVVPDWKERGRFGGIRGRVESVNLLPATREDVATTTGNPQLAEALTRSGPVMRSLISLEPASPGVAPSHPSSKASAALPGLSRAERDASGRYLWTLSRGSSVFPIREGLTVQAHGYVEWRTPITYLLPVLRELTGTYRTLRQERRLDAPSLRQQGGAAMTETPHELLAQGSLRREWPFLLGMAVLLAVLLHANAPEVWFWFAALLVLLLWRWLAWASRRQARLEARPAWR